jgi:hypothetical protein
VVRRSWDSNVHHLTVFGLMDVLLETWESMANPLRHLLSFDPLLLRSTLYWGSWYIHHRWLAFSSSVCRRFIRFRLLRQLSLPPIINESFTLWFWDVRCFPLFGPS